MKYYSEDEMRDIRAAFEETILSWPNVSTKKMFGCPCYKADNKLFAFLVTGGVVITKLSESDQETLSNLFETTPFQAGKKSVKQWSRVSIPDKTELSRCQTTAKQTYGVRTLHSQRSDLERLRLEDRPLAFLCLFIIESEYGQENRCNCGQAKCWYVNTV